MQLKMKKKKKKRIRIHVKPEALVSCSETSVSIVIFLQLQNKMHAHLAGLIWASHVFEYILLTKPGNTPCSSVTTLEEDALFLEMPFNCTHFQDSSMTILGTHGYTPIICGLAVGINHAVSFVKQTNVSPSLR